jgi:ABC-type transport system involved in multi-copper enzyme maturation permease subunit
MAFAYTLLLSAMMVWRYHEFMKESANSNLDAMQRSAALGHEVFSLLTWMQVLVWMLIAPALTAPAIATERESGLLNDLLLSHLKPWQIVAGKMWSAMSFILLMILISLPITAMCFLLGGVSGGEFGAALLLQSATAFTCAMMGLAASAHYRRAVPAMTMSYLFLILWNISSAISYALSIAGRSVGPGSIYSFPSWLLDAGEIYGASNPILAAVDLVSPLRLSISRGIGAGTLLDEWPLWMPCIFLLLIFALSRFWHAVREVRKPEGEPAWLERRRNKGQNATTDETRGDRQSTLQRVGAAQGREKAAKRRSWSIPFVSRLSFSNPLLQRETRSKFHIRRPSTLIVVLFLLPLATVSYLYVRLFFYTLRDSDTRDFLVPMLAIVYMFVAILMTAMMGSSAFTRERETGTWENLLLTLLPPRAIILAKVLAPVVACSMYSLVLWPLIIPCIRRLRYSQPGQSSWQLDGMSLTQIVAGCLILLGVAWLCTCWGMLCSWYSKRTATAMGWTIGSMFLVWIFAPIFLVWTSNSFSNNDSIGEFMRYCHPLVALMPIVERRFPSDLRTSVIWDGVTSFMGFFLLGCLLLGIIYRELRRESGLDRN